MQSNEKEESNKKIDRLPQTTDEYPFSINFGMLRFPSERV